MKHLMTKFGNVIAFLVTKGLKNKQFYMSSFCCLLTKELWSQNCDTYMQAETLDPNAGLEFHISVPKLIPGRITPPIRFIWNNVNTRKDTWSHILNVGAMVKIHILSHIDDAP